MGIFASLDRRTHRVLMTSGALYVGRFGAALSVLVTIPMARHALSPELFGVWMMLSAVLGFFAFADLGVGNAVLNSITAALAIGDSAQVRRVLVGGYVCTTLVGLVVIGTWILWCQIATNPSAVAGHIAPENRETVLAAMHIFVVLLAINVSASLIQKIQLGAQQGHWIGAAQLVTALLVLVAVPTTLRLGGGLQMLVLSSLGVMVVVNVASTILWVLRSGVNGAVHWSEFDSATIQLLFRRGSQFLVIQLAAAFAFQSDVIVITQLLGQAEYGDFAAVQRLFAFSSIFISAALLGLWPAFGDALARGELEWARTALKRALYISFVFAGAICVSLALSLGWVAKLWLGTATATPLLLTSLLGLWAMMEALGIVVATFLNGAGVVRQQAAIAIAMAIVSFGGKWVLVAEIGVAGGVLATIISYFAISVPAQVFLVRRFFGESAKTAGKPAAIESDVPHLPAIKKI